MGFPPILIKGFGIKSVSSLSLVPKPPARINTFMQMPPSPEKNIADLKTDRND